MTLLPDHLIEQCIHTKDLLIDPFFTTFLGPETYYLHLGHRFYRPKLNTPPMHLGSATESQIRDCFDYFETLGDITLQPHEFLLAETFEYIGVSADYVIQLFNSSTLARFGIHQASTGLVHAGCGMPNPGKITLELYNSSPFTLQLSPTQFAADGAIQFGTEIMRIVVHPLVSPPRVDYGQWKKGIYGKNTVELGRPFARATFEEFRIPPSSLHLTQDYECHD